MDLRQLLVHELGPQPWSLALFDGALVKTNKAVLPKLLEDGIESLQCLPAQTTAVIIDAMAMLQTLNKIPERFSQLAEMIFKRILMQVGEAGRVDFVLTKRNCTPTKRKLIHGCFSMCHTRLHLDIKGLP